MALERSVLNEDSIRAILGNEYGLGLIEKSNLALGSANCYKVHCEEGDFFLKEYQSEFTADRVDREAKLVSYLAERNFPVAGFIKTLNAANAIVYDGHVISVQVFVEGRTYLNDLPHALLMKGAGYLGKLHALLKDYPMETGMDYRWASGVSSEAASKKFDALLDALSEDDTDPNRERIRGDLLFKKTNPVAKSEESKVEGILGRLFDYYGAPPEALPEDFRPIAEREGRGRAAVDYISGMTDSYAMEKYGELFIPFAWSVK